jgi:hypothetical protein
MKVRLRLVRRWVDGVACPYPRVVLQVRDRYGMLVPLDFRIDCGADFTAIPLSTAREEKIPYQETRQGIATGLVGATAKFRDRVKVVIAGEEHEWPCDFVDVPPPAPGRQTDPLLKVGMLGRAGFLDDYAFAIDSGYIVLTRLGPWRKWFRQRLHALWQALGIVHKTKEPL